MVSKQTEPSRNPKKIFIDSSVLIAAAISPKGSARDLIIGAINNQCKIIISDLVLEETQRNLTNKAPNALPALQIFLEALNPEIIIPKKSSVLKVSKVVELKDAPIVAGAISAKADYLVSYDKKHLLQQKKIIKDNFGLHVVKPNEV